MNKVYSIITAVYNVADKIEKTIKSVISQNEELYEYIIVDGNSQDGTVEILERYQKDYPNNIRFISEPDKGIYDAMNKGIDMAEGEYLLFIGAGDTLRDNILQTVKDMLSFKIEMVYGLLFLEKRKMIFGGEYDKYKITARAIPHPATFYKKEIFQIMGKYSLSYPIAADYDFNIKCFGNNNIYKKYIDIIVANFEEGGISDIGRDEAFANAIGHTILTNLGIDCYKYHRYSGMQFTYFLKNYNNKKVAIFGDGEIAIEIYNRIQHYNEELGRNIQVMCFFTDDSSRLGETFCNQLIVKIEEKIVEQVDKIIIASLKYLKIEELLLKMSVHQDKIIIARELLYSQEFIEFINSENNKEVIIFGTGAAAYKVINYIKEVNRTIQIRFFLDNNPEKWGKTFLEFKIQSLSESYIKEDDIIIIASSWARDIKKQLLIEGIKKEQIISAMY